MCHYTIRQRESSGESGMKYTNSSTLIDYEGIDLEMFNWEKSDREIDNGNNY